jgi:hypothetical protein
MELWIDRRVIRAGYGWSFPAGGELRVGVGSFEPRDRVREPTVALARELELEPVGYQGNWIPHKLRPATENGVFFVGDSAGHCLPLTAEGIRPAFYFALALGRELCAALAGQVAREQALARYHAFSARHSLPFSAMLAAQHLAGRATGTPPLNWLVERFTSPRISYWAFERYLRITPAPAPARATAAVLG